MTAIGEFEFDEIGRWSELKLEIVEQYGAAYTTAFAGPRGRNLRKYYIDAFSGAGVHVAKDTGRQIEGSPARALRVDPPFDHLYFIDLNPQKTAHLKVLCGERRDVDIITEDATLYLTQKLLPSIQYEKFNRALCFGSDSTSRSDPGRRPLSEFSGYGHKQKCDLEESRSSISDWNRPHEPILG